MGLWTDALEMLGPSNPFQGTAQSGPTIKSDGGFKVRNSLIDPFSGFGKLTAFLPSSSSSNRRCAFFEVKSTFVSRRQLKRRSLSWKLSVWMFDATTLSQLWSEER